MPEEMGVMGCPVAKRQPIDRLRLSPITPHDVDDSRRRMYRCGAPIPQ